jgi:thiomorpholine-carboxylate dehydrogenase
MALVLAEADVRELVSAADLIDPMERALAAFSEGQVNQPVRTAVDAGPERAFFGVMPGYLALPPTLGAKLVTVFSENTSRGLPTHFATIVLLSPQTGEVEALVDGRYITAARTAAVSAVAVRRLGRADASVLAILGSGVQARSHLDALPVVANFCECRAWSPTAGHLARLLADPRAVELSLRAAASAEEAVRGADVILLAISSSAPVIQRAWVEPGSLVISLGAYRPDMREMDPELVTGARVIVDSRQAALVEAGDIVQGMREGRFTEAHIAGELGDVILGRKPGRSSEREIVIFKSLGMAVEDLAAAQLAYTRARMMGKGREIAL